MNVISSVDEFKEKVVDGAGYILVDFSAQWCGPCQMLGPVLNDLEKVYEGKLTFYKVDIDEVPELSNGFGIHAVPTMLIFEGGKVEISMQGLQSKEMLTAKINAVLENNF